MTGLSKTSIPYADYAWQIVTGCSPAGEGCRHCYAARLAATRLKRLPQYAGLAEKVSWTYGADRKQHDGYEWTGEIRFHDEQLERPLHTRKPGVVFVAPMGDLFHEQVTDEQIAAAFGTMALGEPSAILKDGRWWPTTERHHTYLIVTKRPERMMSLLANPDFPDLIGTVAGIVPIWPMPHLWLLPTIWDQESADRVIPLLLDTPAAGRGISLEPMLGAVRLDARSRWGDCLRGHQSVGAEPFGEYLVPGRPSLELVILGGESGPGARPMQPEWALDVYRQCRAAGVPFWFKQPGDWLRREIEAGRYVPTGEYREMERAREWPEVTP